MAIRHTLSTRPSASHRGPGNQLRDETRGQLLAGTSLTSRYIPGLKDGYVFRGLDNPLAARIRARLLELGLE